MKVLIERHAHEDFIQRKITCPRCHSELLIEEGDLIEATFARLIMRYYTDLTGKISADDFPDYHDTYKATVVLCPVCDRYIMQNNAGALISLIDKRID